MIALHLTYLLLFWATPVAIAGWMIARHRARPRRSVWPGGVALVVWGAQGLLPWLVWALCLADLCSAGWMLSAGPMGMAVLVNLLILLVLLRLWRARPG